MEYNAKMGNEVDATCAAGMNRHRLGSNDDQVGSERVFAQIFLWQASNYSWREDSTQKECSAAIKYPDLYKRFDTCTNEMQL